MFPRAERPSEKKKDRFRPKETYEWYREEAILLKAKQSAFQTSLEECCVLLADIAEEVYNYDAIKDSSSGILYMKKLLHRLATWKRNIENPYTHKRAARLYTDEPEVDTTDRRREAETNKELEELKAKVKELEEDNVRLTAELASAQKGKRSPGGPEDARDDTEVASTPSRSQSPEFMRTPTAASLAKARPASAPTTRQTKPFKFASSSKPLLPATETKSTSKQTSRILELSTKLARARSHPLLALRAGAPEDLESVLRKKYLFEDAPTEEESQEQLEQQLRREKSLSLHKINRTRSLEEEIEDAKYAVRLRAEGITTLRSKSTKSLLKKSDDKPRNDIQFPAFRFGY